MARRIARQPIFQDDADREDFVQRVARLAEAEALTVYAWALLPNHFHPLVRTGRQPLARSMRSLLTGYAGAFNRRYRRSGHVFQNRYKSVVCDEEAYFLELVRYLHLNPLRARIVADLEGLAKYAYSGHVALVGTRAYGWQDIEAVLTQFGTARRRAQQEYLRFVEAGVKQGRRVELQGGGLIRSAGGWQAVQELRRGREGYAGDERILGSSEFVEQVRQEVEGRQAHGRGTQRVLPVERVIEQVCQAVGVRAEELRGSGRRATVSRVRAGVAYLWLEWLGQSGPAAARALGVHPATIYEMAQRGRQEAAYWEQLCADAKPEFPGNVPK
ncbi:MAG TPA: transposase [Candidatus Binatia bacterium]|jgi:REP element-mobilizing transposase RayT|nr:transposase [Candidatus Binatia bacterium]